ncbi:MAG: chorismate synthase [Candidatus Promineifilaceae bacterium]
MEILGGPYFAIAGAGESHGPGISTIIYGCPPGFRLSRINIQQYLDRRRPGGTRHGTPRQEKDKVVLLSGLYDADHERLLAGPEVQTTVDGAVFVTSSYEEGLTTGEPISALVLSTGTHSDHYTQFAGSQGEVRPGHTDLVKHYQSRGFVDPRGGGRSSYRSTISDVVGGSVARAVLQELFGTRFLSAIVQVGPLRAEQTLAVELGGLLQKSGGQRLAQEAIDTIENTLTALELPTLDAAFADDAAGLIKETRIAGDSLGAMVEVVAVNPPALAGEPLYNSLKQRLMGVLGGLHAAQVVEIGDGLQVVSRRGSDNNDPIRRQGYVANSHGGLIGGITTGMPIVARVGFKPTSSIVKPQLSVRKDLEEIDFELRKGRHDPCVGVRAGVTLESRLAIELLNAVLAHETRYVDPEQFGLF